MVTKIVDGLDSVIRAWRYHLAIPANLEEVRKLIRTGPEPVNSDAIQPGGKGHNRPPMGLSLDGFDPFAIFNAFWDVEYDKGPQKPYHALVDLLDIRRSTRTRPGACTSTASSRSTTCAARTTTSWPRCPASASRRSPT